MAQEEGGNRDAQDNAPRPLTTEADLENIDWGESTFIIRDQEHGVTIYLIGTAHVSKKSVFECEEIIKDIQPQALCIELCTGRQGVVVSSDPVPNREQELRAMRQRRAEGRERNTDSSSSMVTDRGAILNAVLNTLRTSSGTSLVRTMERMSMNLGRLVEVLPGTEFRAAFRAHVASQPPKVPRSLLTQNTHVPFIAVRTSQQTEDDLIVPVYLVDRPVGVTMKRLSDSMTLWRKMTLIWELLKTNLDEEELMRELARYRNTDMITEMIREVGESFPEVVKYVIDERDIFIGSALKLTAISLRQDCSAYLCPHGPSQPLNVVAIVGRGHLEGIKRVYESLPNDRQEVFKICKNHGDAMSMPLEVFMSDTEKRVRKFLMAAVAVVGGGLILYGTSNTAKAAINSTATSLGKFITSSLKTLKHIAEL
mmetsp:Transcript_23642/g.59553  ORF Transcript_23642/g.59553 Transcript_23642/m.59553 type:complete len:425 (-) Transcript_23642:773-2047(-)